MEKIEFLHPEILNFGLVFLLGIFFWIIYQKFFQKKKLAISVPFLADLKKAEKKMNLRKKQFLIFLKWATFFGASFLLLIALARPQEISTEEKISKNGVDILIALDISESMLSQDLQPNRIEAAKKYISDFVSNLKNDRVGLEVFAGKPFTQSPLSFDYNVVRYYLGEISTENINQRKYGLNGTAIGDAILAAVNRFKNSPDRTKVLILLTDGEANVGTDPIVVSEYARSNGIKIYTIGIGRKDGRYQNHFDEKSLKDIAKISGGEYFWAGDNQSLEKSLEKISNLEKTEYEADVVTKKKDLFWDWLFWGFILAFLSILAGLTLELFPKIKLKK